MAPIFLHNGGILLRNGAIAVNPNCCCSSSSSSTFFCEAATEWRLVVYDNYHNLLVTLLNDSITDNLDGTLTLDNYPTEWKVHRYWLSVPNIYKIEILCVGDWFQIETWTMDDYSSCMFEGGGDPSWWMSHNPTGSYDNQCCPGQELLAGGTPPNQGALEGSTFNGTTDSEWTNMNNWDDGTKMELPTNSATLAAGVYSSSISNISLQNLTVTSDGILGINISVQASATIQGSIIDSSLNPICGTEGTLTCQSNTTVLITDFASVNGGTITGADIVTFDSNATIGNNGLITDVQTVNFNDNSTAYSCQIDGEASFNNLSSCYGPIIAISISFHDIAMNYDTLTGGGNITEDITFTDTSYNDIIGTVNGHYDVPIECTINSVSGFVSDFMLTSHNFGTVQRVKFMDSSYNSGTATESLFIDTSYNTSNANDSNFCNNSYSDTTATATGCKFFNTSENRGTGTTCTFADTSRNTNSGTVTGSTFTETSYNDGNAQNVDFEDDSYNNTNGVTDIARFHDTSENRGTCNTNSLIDTEFYSCAKNKGTCMNNAKFYNGSINHSSGTIGGGFFYDSSINMGTVSGGAQFNSSASPPRCCNNGYIAQSATFSGTSFNNGTAGVTSTYNGYTGYISSFTSDCGDNISVDAYFVGGQKTTLDSSGNGCWDGREYTNGVWTGSC